MESKQFPVRFETKSRVEEFTCNVSLFKIDIHVSFCGTVQVLTFLNWAYTVLNLIRNPV